MIVLYHAPGAPGYMPLGISISDERAQTFFTKAKGLFHARGNSKAIEFLNSAPFIIRDALNDFGDDFYALEATLPLKQYEEIRKKYDASENEMLFSGVADVFLEIGLPIRFIAIELSESQTNPAERPANALKPIEIKKVIEDYMGVHQGYLADFATYKDVESFYRDINLDIDLTKYDGTNREKFVKVLERSSPEIQAEILEGILKRYPVGSSERRTQRRHDEMHDWIPRLRGPQAVKQPLLTITSEVVQRALNDAELLIRSTGATSGVDRAHTALHGYLRAICEKAGIVIEPGATLTKLFKELCQHHPALKDRGSRPNDIERILKALAVIVDTLNPLRNEGSVAHPNENLLEKPEAMLTINSIQSILHYLEDKLFSTN
ncbi:MAG: abortive infection family protein [Bdellovibrionota bacterium]